MFDVNLAIGGTASKTKRHLWDIAKEDEPYIAIILNLSEPCRGIDAFGGLDTLSESYDWLPYCQAKPFLGGSLDYHWRWTSIHANAPFGIIQTRYPEEKVFRVSDIFEVEASATCNILQLIENAFCDAGLHGGKLHDDDRQNKSKNAEKYRHRDPSSTPNVSVIHSFPILLEADRTWGATMEKSEAILVRKLRLCQECNNTLTWKLEFVDNVRRIILKALWWPVFCVR